MERGRAAGIFVAAMATAACAGEQPPPEETSEQVGYILIDDEAREAGRTLDGLAGDDLALPIEVVAGEAVDLVLPNGESVELEVEPGSVLVVREQSLAYGEPLERRVLGRDVASDRVIVVGTEEAARGLAGDVGGELVTDAEGRFVIELTSVYAELSHISPPEGIDEILPAPRDVSDRWTDQLPPEAAPQILPRVEAAARSALAERLSFEGEDQVIRALGEPATSCSDSVVGTWVSRSFYQGYGDWYVFSLHIEKAASDPSQLVGQIDVRSWSGQSETEEPTECEALPASTWGDGFDWTVQMTAAGSLDDGAVRFGGTGWSPKTLRCGESPRPGQYNLDQFKGRIVEGRFIQALNNDGGRMVDDPHVFRRVACAR